MAGDPLIGRQLANYRLERVIGRGGMAQVYYGWDVKLERPVALKVIDARYRDDPDYAGRFVREAQAISRWRHEHVIQIFYAGEEAGLYYFAMEYIDGQDLGQMMAAYRARGERVPAAEVLRIGWAVASALDYAHQRGVIHRDVKPSNIMLSSDGRVVLADFGLALDVQHGSLGDTFGSAHYIAPEQARRSSEAVPQSDLYALGVILYEMLTGAVPFDDPSPTSVAIQHITLPPPAPRSLNPALSAAVEAVLLRALCKAPHERYPTGGELLAALQAALATRAPMTAPAVPAAPSAATAPPAVAPAPRLTPGPARMPRVLLGLGGCSLLLLIVAAASGLLLLRLRASPAPTAAAAAATVTSAPPTLPVLTPTSAAPGSTSTRPPEPTSTSPAPTAAPTALLAETLAVPTEAPTEAGVAVPVPTVKYPTGRRFHVFYDENGLYLLNLSESVVSIYSVAFERLGLAGEPLNRFDGWRWAQFYPNSKPGWCMRIELLDSPAYLRPAECEKGYLSTRTPLRTDPVVFWTAAEGSAEFRVLWLANGAEEEVARCAIGAGRCEVFFP